MLTGRNISVRAYLDRAENKETGKKSRYSRYPLAFYCTRVFTIGMMYISIELTGGSKNDCLLKRAMCGGHRLVYLF